ncbi:MAG: homoserine dehydrogenase [Bacteroidota bacterium]
MARKKLSIGLFGFGCVGFGLYEVIEKTPGLNAEIKRICVKNKTKEREISIENFTFDKNDILNDPEINVVVELIDDADAAFEIVSTALKNGKAVVSANKKMIAENFSELLALQEKHNAPLLYEAAACASLPIIRNLEEYYNNDLLESIEGIVNGSTNYILTKIFNENLSFDEALQQAQELGFAESNPILDTGGFDAKYKLCILNAHAFGIISSPSEIFNYGIDKIGELELNYAKEKGLKIKLVAQSFKSEDGSIVSFVAPKFIPVENQLFGVDDVFNGVITKTCFADKQFFVGKGAGAYPTASAVLSDISALSYDYRYEYKKINENEVLQATEDTFLKVLLRHDTKYLSLFKNYFEEIEESYSNKSAAFIVGVISLENLQKTISIGQENFSFILFEAVSLASELLLEKDFNYAYSS